jgi:molybdopterin molybdotransferase
MALLSIDEARDWVVSHCPPRPVVDVALRDALGCVLAESVRSTEPVPPFANTAMDGYAVRAADTVGASAQNPVRLRVVGTIAAGAEPLATVGPGEAVRIMTGAAMAVGADAVVPVENIARVSAEADEVDVLSAAALGDCIRPAGEDVSVDQQLFTAGTELTPGHLGVLASIGASTVRAQRRLRVGVLSTGDELIAPPTPLRIGQIRDSNRHTLLGLVARLGLEPVDLGLARDNEGDIEAKVRSAVETCDALVTSGGVSMGDFDFVKVVLDRLSAAEGGVAMRWMQIAIKPAKPLAFGVLGGVPVFGLPGNPVSCMVSFELFARPALRRMLGHPMEHQAHIPILAMADEDLRRSPDGKTHFARVRADFGPDGRLHVRSSGGQASNLLRAMADANALAVLPDGPTVQAGSDVPVLLL